MTDPHLLVEIVTRLDLWWIHNVLLASWGQLGYPMPAGYPRHRRMSTQVTGTIDGQVMNHLSHSVIPIMPPYPTHIPIQRSNCSPAKTGETSRISQQLTMSPSDPAQARLSWLVLSCGEEAVAITPVSWVVFQMWRYAAHKRHKPVYS